MTNATQTIYAQVNTKSNFYGTNGKFLEVVEFAGSLVVCKVPLNDNNRFMPNGDTVMNASFSLSEITRLVTTENK